MKPSAVRDLFLHAPRTPDIIRIDARTTLSIVGAGDPSAEGFQRSIGALFAVGYALKAHRRAAGLEDFVIGPLEGEWTIEGPPRPADRIVPADWRWELRLTVPDDVTERQVRDAVRTASAKRHATKAAVEVMQRVARTVVPPGRFGRVLHRGPYADEPRSLEKLEQLLAEQGDARLDGHTEVYLSDPQRTGPEHLRTTLLVRLADR